MGQEHESPIVQMPLDEVYGRLVSGKERSSDGVANIWKPKPGESVLTSWYDASSTYVTGERWHSERVFRIQMIRYKVSQLNLQDWIPYDDTKRLFETFARN